MNGLRANNKMLNSNKYTLKAENLSIGYFHKSGNHIVAKEIHFALAQGELVGLVGANGVGKSTLLRTLSKVQNKLEGSIKIEEK